LFILNKLTYLIGLVWEKMTNFDKYSDKLCVFVSTNKKKSYYLIVIGKNAHLGALIFLIAMKRVVK